MKGLTNIIKIINQSEDNIMRVNYHVLYITKFSTEFQFWGFILMFSAIF